ncbi:major antigen [Phlebotomus argentipes]|uniref:major antigen n=1 Tax=Phlebotomus argentipes TaxID=94469 RepID=UPI002892F0B0|nr:major antigen [Phlebotomus argentipes]
MQNNNVKKETFQLLQYSDDSKSLSDLELTEIVVPRKRKVRRKTKSKGGYKQKQPPPPVPVACKNLGLWISIVTTWCWLLILSYIIAVVNTGNRQLDRQLQKVSATTQNVPGALQEWHETSQYLEANQTALISKMQDVQQTLKNFTEEVAQLKTQVHKKAEVPDDNEKMAVLQTSIADFGAKIKDLSTAVDDLKDRVTRVQQEVHNNTNFNHHLQEISLERRVNDTMANLNSSGPQQMGNLANFTAEYSDKLVRINDTLNAINNVLSQKIKSIEEDETNSKKKIDRLSDSVSNTSSHVSSIEEDWSKYKQDVKELETTRVATETRLSKLENVTDNLMRSLESLRGEARTQSDRFTKDIAMLQQQIQQLASAQEELKLPSPPAKAGPQQPSTPQVANTVASSNSSSSLNIEK